MGRLPAPLLPGQRAVMGRREDEFGQLMHSEAIGQSKGMDIYLHDNRSTTNREPNEPTLYSSAKPHQTRPLTDSNVFYHLDFQEKQLKIGLKDRGTYPDHDIDSLRLSTKHTLCLNCIDAIDYFCTYRTIQSKSDVADDDSEPPTLPSNCVIHHANLLSLYCQAAVAECHICTAIYRRLDRWNLNYPAYQEYRIELAFPQNRRSQDGGANDLLVFAMVRSDTKKEPIWNWSVLLELRLWPEDRYMHHFHPMVEWEDLGPESPESLSTIDSSSGSSVLTQVLARSWLRKCLIDMDGKHAECNKQHDTYLPTRLLDVRHAAETSQVRIVCPQDDPFRFNEDRRYATLSHCWGSWGAAENPNLTTENLEFRKAHGMSYDHLPKTFLHAFEVAGWLNIPYLWIDSLCILQDSRSDWIHEASLMHHTYQSSTINISASNGSDSRTGLFSGRNPLQIKAQQFKAREIPKSWFVTPDNVFGWTSVAPAFSRAWIHRERQLARRILHFNGVEAVWECCGTHGSGFASERLPGGAPFRQLWNDSTKYQSISNIVKSKKGKQATYAIWNELCETFSVKELTVKSDMPVILSSLAQEFHESLPGDEYIAGMWRDTLPQALAWHTIRSWPDDYLSGIAPSWSWLSAPAPIGVGFVKEANIEHLIPLARLLDVEITQEKEHEEDIYGPVKSGVLRFEGFMRKIWFNFEEDGKFELSVADNLIDGNEDDNSTSRLRTIGKSWDEQEGQVCKVEFDGVINQEEHCCWIMFTSIKESIDSRNLYSQDRTITAILLQRSSDNDDSAPWVRTGMMTMKDLIAFKMRYKACYGGTAEKDGGENRQGNGVKESDHGLVSDNLDETDQTGTQQATREDNKEVTNTTPDNTPHETTIGPKDSPRHSEQNQLEPQDSLQSQPARLIEPCEAANNRSATSLTHDVLSPTSEITSPIPYSHPESVSEPEPQPGPNNSPSPAPSSLQSLPEDFDIWAEFAYSVKKDRFEVRQAEQAAQDVIEKDRRENGNEVADPGTDGTTNGQSVAVPVPVEDLNPLASLYQFDHGIEWWHRAKSFKWLKRLDVRIIEIA